MKVERQKLTLFCRKCQSPIYVNIILENLLGAIKATLSANKINVSFSALVAKNISIKMGGYICSGCGIKIDDTTDILLFCPYSQKFDLVENFSIIRATSKVDGKKFAPVLIHKDYESHYIGDVEAANFEIYKRQAKLELGKEGVEG